MKRSWMKSSPHKILLGGILFLAVLLRFVYLIQIRPTPLFDFLAADTGDFERFAGRILEVDFYYRQTIYFNPLYPFFLALVYLLCGHHPFAAALGQALLDSWNCLLLYFICLKTFKSRTIGLLAAFIYSGYGLAIFYTGILVGESLATFLSVLLVLVLLRAAESRGPCLWLLAGLIFGLGALLRPNLLFVLPFLVLWMIMGASRFPRRINEPSSGAVVPLVLLFLGMALVLIPFSYRNYVITGEFNLPFGNGGFNFYIGNHRGAKGTYTYLRNISSSPSEQIKSSLVQAKKVLGGNASLSAASGYWFKQGIRFIREYPLEFITLQGRKFLLFWNALEIGQNVDYYFSKRFSSLLRFPLISFGLIAPLAWLGFVFALRRKPPDISLLVWFLIASVGSVIVFFVSARYRLPSVPVIIIFAGYGAYQYARLLLPLRSAKIGEVIIFSGLLVIFYIVAHLDLAPFNPKECLSWSHSMLANVYEERGEMEKAIEEFHQALAVDPDNPMTRNFLGSVYWKRGREEEAIREYRKALELDPDNATAHNNLGVAYAEQGKIQDAFREFQEVLRINPDFGEAHSNLAVYYFYYGNDLELARYHIDRAVQEGYELPAKLLQDLEASRR